MEELRWLADSPPTSVDRRVLEILRWLDRQKQPKTYKQIERCGPRTIDELLRKVMVTNCGMDDDVLNQIRIAPGGRDQIEIEERWKRKRAARASRNVLRA